MAKGVKPRVKVPKTAAAGEIVTLKTLISHKMESGQRKDKDGNKIPQSIIHRFTCALNGNVVIDVKMAAAISTNPYFHLTPLFLRQVSFTLRGMMTMVVFMKLRKVLK